jgi:hypothetical protein
MEGKEKKVRRSSSLISNYILMILYYIILRFVVLYCYPVSIFASNRVLLRFRSVIRFVGFVALQMKREAFSRASAFAAAKANAYAQQQQRHQQSSGNRLHLNYTKDHMNINEIGDKSHIMNILQLNNRSVEDLICAWREQQLQYFSNIANPRRSSLLSHHANNPCFTLENDPWWGKNAEDSSNENSNRNNESHSKKRLQNGHIIMLKATEKLIDAAAYSRITASTALFRQEKNKVCV